MIEPDRAAKTCRWLGYGEQSCSPNLEPTKHELARDPSHFHGEARSPLSRPILFLDPAPSIGKNELQLFMLGMDQLRACSNPYGRPEVGVEMACGDPTPYSIPLTRSMGLKGPKS